MNVCICSFFDIRFSIITIAIDDVIAEGTLQKT